MACYKPLKGYITPSGGFSFARKESTGQLTRVPCGRCIGCRLDRSRDWAVRCMHEAHLQDENCFITLTYAPEHLPGDLSLNHEHFQKFMRDLRYRFSDRKIRYLMCGEYGEKLSRPHYHAVLFGVDFSDDWELHSKKGGYAVYTSATLSELWPFGFHYIGSVTHESAAYVARYCTKKIVGEKAEEHYERVHPRTGEILQLQPEYATMSRRPGLGEEFFQLYADEIYPADEVISNGYPRKPPRYYDKLYEKRDPVGFEKVKKERKLRMRENADNCTDERLEVREKVQLAKFDKLMRSYESDISR